MKINIKIAQRFLDALEPDGKFTFQTFADKKGSQDFTLIEVLHGTLAEHSNALDDLNQKGAGIFVMVNRGDGVVQPGAKTCRTKANVIAVRALFVDLDGAPIEPVMNAKCPPDIIVQSSPGKYHAYWRMPACPLDNFKSNQQKLAELFNGDKAVNDLPRVMRLPGFVHQKAQPFLTQILKDKK